MSAPKQIEKYRITGELGRGGMGVVYRGEASDGSCAAIKVMLPASSGSGAVRRFAREASIHINHPNVVEILGAGDTEEGHPYIAFEMLDGHSLDRVIAERMLSPEEVVDIAAQVCDGLSAAHGAGVVHRDLKPGNLFLCRDGIVKILDFGIAYVDSDETRVTGAGMVIGTPAYLSPEQAHGAGDIDERVDIWALGAILYELFTGRPPFVRDSLVAVLLAVVMDELVPLREYAAEVAPQLAAVVERALLKDRDARWPDAKSFREALVTAKVRAKPTDTMVGTGVHSSLHFGGEESRVVSLLFAEKLDDRAAFEEIIAGYGGVSVLLLNGNAIGVFGAERWEGDEPMRAASAALAVGQLAPRVGLASGRGVASRGSITGAVVEAASAACRAASEGVVLIDRETAASIAGRFELSTVDDEHAKLVERRRGQRSHKIPFIGRRLEKRQLELAIDTVLEEERAVVVYISGTAGIGKTRVLEEFVGITRRESINLLVLRGTAESSQRNRSLWVLAEMVRDLLDREAHAELVGAGEMDALKTYIDRLEIDDADREQVAIGLAQTFDTAPAELEQSNQLDPVLVSDQVFLAFEAYLRACCSRHPVAIVIDDWQWADRASRELLVKLQEQLSDDPVLFVIAERDAGGVEGSHEFAGAEMIRLALRGFGRKEVKALAEAVIGDEMAADVVDAMLSKTEGNPLFIEQLAATLNGPHGTIADGSTPLPINVEAAIQSRLDRLPSRGKKLCKLLSAFERPALDVELFAVGAKDVGDTVKILIREGIVEDRSRDRSGVWFRSPLVAEVAYRQLSDDDRVEAHQRIASVLREHNADPEEVARHLERGVKPLSSAPFYSLAARAAAARGDSQSVIRCGEKAIALGVASCELFLIIAEAHGHLGDRDLQAKALAQALDARETLRDDVGVYTAQAIWEWRMGRLEQALETGTTAIASARRFGDSQLLSSALGWHGIALAYSGRLEEARAAVDEAYAHAGKEPAKLALASHWRGLVAATAGDLGMRLKAFEEAAGLYHRAGNLRRAVAAESNLADAYNRAGAYDEARGALLACLEGCDRLRLESIKGYVLGNLAYALIGLAEHVEALQTLERAYDIAVGHGDLRLQTTVLRYRAKAELGRGHLEEARAAATAAIAAAEQCKQPGLKAAAFAVRSVADRQLGHGDAALADSAEAMAIRDKLGGLEEDEIDVYLARARALADDGRGDEAAQVIEQGRSRLRLLARQIGDELWRNRFLEAPPAHRQLLSQ